MDFRMQNTREPLSTADKTCIEEKTEEGWHPAAIGELLSRPESTVRSYLDRKNNPDRAYHASKALMITGTPNQCTTCGERLRQGTEDGFRIEWCGNGCRDKVNPAYLGEFRVR